MVNKKIALEMLVMALVIDLVLTGCPSVVFGAAFRSGVYGVVNSGYAVRA